MYFIYDKSAFINNIGRMLGVKTNGRYSDSLKLKVLYIQSSNEFEANGIVDYKTFGLIKKYYNNQKAESFIKSRYPRLYVNDLVFGGFGEAISELNKALYDALGYFRYYNDKPKGRYYGKETENAVRYLRSVFLLNDGGVDIEFLYRLLLFNLKMEALDENKFDFREK